MQQLLTAQKESDKKKMEKKNKEKEKYLAGKTTRPLFFYIYSYVGLKFHQYVLTRA